MEGGKVEEVVASTDINAGIDAVERVIDDIPSSVQWLPECREARVIRIVDDYTKEILFITGVPWPLAARESLLISQKHADERTGELVIEFHSVNDPDVPVGKGNVRVRPAEGQWVLKAEGRNRTSVVYSVKGDPGQSVLAYLVNKASRNLAFNMLRGLKSFIMHENPGNS